MAEDYEAAIPVLNDSRNFFTNLRRSYEHTSGNISPRLLGLTVIMLIVQFSITIMIVSTCNTNTKTPLL